MEQNSVILYTIIIVVLIGIPVLLSRKSGKNPMELLFGKRAERGLFGGKKKESGGSEAQNGQPQTGRQTNSNRNDFMDLISRLATYARKNHFRLIIPGTLSCGGTTAVLTALIITRSKVVGINCFGFGGRVIAAEREKDWTQVMNGVETTFPSPLVKNSNQERSCGRSWKKPGLPVRTWRLSGCSPRRRSGCPILPERTAIPGTTP